MPWWRGNEPTWRRNDNVPSGHAGYDRMRARVDRQEAQRTDEIDAALAKFDKHGHLHHHTDHELHRMGFTVQRGFFGNRTGIVPTEVMGDRHHNKTVERRRRQLDRKQARKDTARRVARRVILGEAKPKTKLVYWGKANKYK